MVSKKSSPSNSANQAPIFTSIGEFAKKRKIYHAVGKQQQFPMQNQFQKQDQSFYSITTFGGNNHYQNDFIGLQNQLQSMSTQNCQLIQAIPRKRNRKNIIRSADVKV